MAVIPRDGQGDREADDQRRDDGSKDYGWPGKRIGDQVHRLPERQRGAEVGDAPLQDLVVLDLLPDAELRLRGRDGGDRFLVTGIGINSHRNESPNGRWRSGRRC
jgi:hypothetical protein